MLRDDEQLERAKPEATGLESYRRLIELQRQMIQLSQQHAQAKRERDTLREVVAQEVADNIRSRRSLRHRIQRFAVKIFKRLLTTRTAEATSRRRVPTPDLTVQKS